MTSKESALLAQMQDLGYNHATTTTALSILSQSKIAQDDALLYLYDEHPTQDDFIDFLASMCEGDPRVK